MTLSVPLMVQVVSILCDLSGGDGGGGGGGVMLGLFLVLSVLLE